MGELEKRSCVDIAKTEDLEGAVQLSKTYPVESLGSQNPGTDLSGVPNNLDGDAIRSDAAIAATSASGALDTVQKREMAPSRMILLKGWIKNGACLCYLGGGNWTIHVTWSWIGLVIAKRLPACGREAPPSIGRFLFPWFGLTIATRKLL